MEDDVLRCRPSAEPPFQAYSDEFGEAQLPGLAGEHVDGIGTAHAHSYHAQSTGIRSVGVGAHHHAAGEGIVLEYHLVDDAGTGLPEADVIAGGGRPKEVVHFLVLPVGGPEVVVGTLVGTDEVVAVHTGRHGHLLHAGVHKLQQGHLRRSILHSHAVGTEVGVVGAAVITVQAVGRIEVCIENFLGQCEAAP